jgi:hypothetical protein
MTTKRIATTALDWGVLAAKIPAENKVRMHYLACEYFSFLIKTFQCFVQCCGSAFVSVRIRIQLFTLMLIWIKGAKSMRIRIMVPLFRHKNLIF